MSVWNDLGSGYRFSFTCWKPDRDLNPQYSGVPDVDRWGARIECPHGPEFGGHVTFDGPVQRLLVPDSAMWAVQSFDPLTISPSVLMVLCKCHGFITEGRWNKA
jgi:Family of unknown function (DUF6527)